MTNQKAKAEKFHALHQKGNPIVLYNIWDAGSANTVKDAGAKAIGTSSWAVAEANGFADGEAIPVSALMRVLKSISSITDLPVTADIESGYGADPQEVANTAKHAIQAGVVGFNLEDQIIGKGQLCSLDEQVVKIRACREMADEIGIPVFINARTDTFLVAKQTDRVEALEKLAIERAIAYADAGANGFFTPGLVDVGAIKRLCAVCPIPLNIMMMPGVPSIQTLTDIGVSRISFGPGPYLELMGTLKNGAKSVFS